MGIYYHIISVISSLTFFNVFLEAIFSELSFCKGPVEVNAKLSHASQDNSVLAFTVQ